MLLILGLFYFVALLPTFLCSLKSIPTLPLHYTVKGTIFLPYAEIKEPFTAYYDAINNRSRVDYYDDLVLTFQRGDIVDDTIKGVNYKIAYTVDNLGNTKKSCFKLDGNDIDPVKLQSALPTLNTISLFNYDSNISCSNNLDGLCEKWIYNYKIADKTNRYTFCFKRLSAEHIIPVSYEMNGYNSLFGSHYDKYLIEYNYFKETVDEDKFIIPNLGECGKFPGIGQGSIRHFYNPMGEFFPSSLDENILYEEFQKYKKLHKIKYNNAKEESIRYKYFIDNHRFVQSTNRKNNTYTLELNHFFDKPLEFLRMTRGRLVSSGYNGGLLYKAKDESIPLPNYWDWRLYGAVNPVKDQAICGSCWSFGVTGTIEGIYFVQTGHLIRLSEQQLIDCSWNFGNNGCDGGEDFRSYRYIESAGGIALEEDYGHYIGQDGKCHDKSIPNAVQLKGFINVTRNDPNALKRALVENGPITIGIDASIRSFAFYSHGVYNEPECSSKIEDMNHQVLLVGYGTLGKEPYWLIKNSWSSNWGNDGYILISQKNNICGVMNSPTYPIIK